MTPTEALARALEACMYRDLRYTNVERQVRRITEELAALGYEVRPIAHDQVIERLDRPGNRANLEQAGMPAVGDPSDVGSGETANSESAAGDRAPSRVPIEQAAEAADREAAGLQGATGVDGPPSRQTSAAADLDVEALAAALQAMIGDGRRRDYGDLIVPLSTPHEAAALIAAAYAAALAEKGER